MFAAGEMQTSGEPFASGFAGRNLGNYDRSYLPTDQYILNNGSSDTPATPTTDLFGFSTAVESYEYSKYHMNMVIQETTAGVSLANGPLVSALPGATPLDRLRARMENLLTAAGTDAGGWATLPAPIDNPLNYLGFPGVSPSFAPFSDFDPTLQPGRQVVKSCTFKGGYGGIPSIGAMTPIYECSYNSLHLVDPIGQVNRVVTPRVLGLSAWKEALWAIDFAGRVHDAGDGAVNAVSQTDLSSVGKANNQVVPTDPEGSAIGAFIGSSSQEGMWGLTMLANMDNASAWLVSSLLTNDGQKLGGFPTLAGALSYDYGSPLEWFPAKIRVTEDDSVVPYPSVSALTIADATSSSEDLAALLLGHSLFFGTTDPRNAGIGQQLGLQAAFDGDPFAADDGLPDGEQTAHDRSLAVIRVAFVDLDRLHAAPPLGVIVDQAMVKAGTVGRANVVTTTSLAHVLIGLQQTILSLNGAITQYGAPDANATADDRGILNTLPIHPPGGTTPAFTSRVRSVLSANASFVRDVLTTADGHVANSALLASGTATPDASTARLGSQAAAVRALVVGFLVSGDESFRDRARAVASRLETSFHGAASDMYRAVEDGADDIAMTPEIFAWLQSALRETYKVLHLPGDPALDRNLLERRIARVNKLFLNGWDDVDGDEKVDYPAECLQGRLQMSEQLLTGELGLDANGATTGDRDSDCVPELSHAKVASVLASQVHFHSP